MTTRERVCTSETRPSKINRREPCILPIWHATVDAQGLGDTVVVEGKGGLAGFAICHYSPRSEAGQDTCFVKSGAVRLARRRTRPRTPVGCGRSTRHFRGYADPYGWSKPARHEAYQQLVARGYRTAIQGVTMHRRNEPGYCRPGIYIIDDWR
jgi:hypothetical protein